MDGSIGSSGADHASLQSLEPTAQQNCSGEWFVRSRSQHRLHLPMLLPELSRRARVGIRVLHSDFNNLSYVDLRELTQLPSLEPELAWVPGGTGHAVGEFKLHKTGNAEMRRKKGPALRPQINNSR